MELRISAILEENRISHLDSLIPWKNEQVIEIADDLFAAYIEIGIDQFCPYGVFPVSCAVDLSKKNAMVRATFEAIERYCLAAFGLHTEKIRNSAAISNVLHSPFTTKLPNLNDDYPCFPVQTIGGLEYSHAPLGDIFAPYKIRLGHATLPPSTNGVSVAKNLATAVEGAFRELYERDCIMRFWYSEHRHNARIINNELVRLFAYAPCRFLEDLGYQLIVLNISRDIRACACLAFCVQRGRHFPYFACSAASKSDMSSSVLSAMLELVQTIVALGLQPDRYEQWIKNKSPMTTLEHNMFYYAAHEKSKLAVNEIIQLAQALNPEHFCAASQVGFNIVDILTELGETIYYADISSERLNGIYCARALSTSLWPLVVCEEIGPFEIVNSSSRFLYPHPFP